MSPHQLAAIAIRLFAIWLAIYVARVAPSFYAEIEKYESPSVVGVAIFVAILSLLLIAVLWFFPRTVAKTLVPESRSVATDAASPDMWFAIGCSLIGMWLISTALPGLARLVYMWLFTVRTHTSFVDWRSEAIYYSAYLLVGVWLLLGANGARKIFWWARRAGHE